MKPPICELCGKDFRSEHFHTNKGGELILFSDYEPLPENMVGGHPRGAGWFCAQHAKEAKLCKGMTLDQAVGALRTKLNVVLSHREYGLVTDPTLWVTNVGPNRAKVFAVIRASTNAAPSAVQDLLNQNVFQIAQGWPMQFAALEKALREAGATVEIRYDDWDRNWAHSTLGGE